MSEVLLERPSPAVAIVRLNRPEVRNALNLSIRQQLAETFKALAGDQKLRCVVLTGNEQAFASGADIADMSRIDAIEMYHRHTERLWGAVGECAVPVIAAVNGFALGGGLELAMHADIIIAGKGARLGQPEVNVGIMPGAGGTQRLVRAIGKHRAMLALLTGSHIGAHEAFAAGLVSKVVEDSSVVDEAVAIAGQIASMPALAVAEIKRTVLAGMDAPLDVALMLERRAAYLLFGTRDKQEAMRAFLEKRPPVFSGT